MPDLIMNSGSQHQEPVDHLHAHIQTTETTTPPLDEVSTGRSGPARPAIPATTDAGVANGTPEHAPISDAVAADITRIVKSACQTMQLSEEQQWELRHCLPVLISPDSSPLDRGHALLTIQEKQLMPLRGNSVKDGLRLFKLSQSGADEFVALARADRTQNGRKHSFTASHERLTTPLADARKDKLDRCVATLTSPDSSRLDRGYALLIIIEDRLLFILRDSTIVDSRKKFGVTRSEVGKLVALAKEHRAQHGGGVYAPAEGARHNGDSTSKPPPASSTHMAAAGGGSTAPASTSTVEQSPGAKQRQPAARETSRPLNGGNHDNSTQPAIELPPPVAPEPADADAKTPQPPTGVTVAPPAETQNKKRQKVIKQAASKSMADTPLAPTKQAERLHDLEAIVDRGIETVFEVGAALEEIRDHELFRPEFKTFGEYLQQRWGWTRARCYQLIGATRVRENLSTRVDNITHLSEPHCRKLGKLTGADQVTAWSEATSAAPDGKVTHENLKKAVAKLLPPAQPMHPDKAPATAAPVGEAAATPDHALPSEPLEEPTTDQPESPPAAPPAALALDEFDIDIDIDTEWLVVEQALTRLFRRCPKYRWPVLWERLNAYLAKNPEHIPVD